MPSKVILIEASPRRANDGLAETVRLAGGGGQFPYFYGGQHYRAGVVQMPTIVTALNFDDGEFGTGGVPQAAELQWAAARKSDLTAIANYFWLDAPISVRIGDENSAGNLPAVVITGKVISANVEGGTVRLQLSDPAADLKKPLLTSRFGGTGGVEGPVEWAGRIKSRIWGRVWNREGQVLDKANNIYCWADPSKPLQAIDALRDKGATAAAINTLAWQGSIAATFAALQAAVAPQGGGVVCPSIACAKWWTQPAGALTADLRGEIGTGYVETTAQIVQRIVAAGPNTAFAAGTIAAAQAARPAAVGWVADSDSTTVASMIEELLGNSSLLWLLNASGEIVIREWTWGASVASATSQSVKRTSVLAPVGTRTLGYKRNETQMARGDLAAIVLWGDIAGDGKPESGATRNAFQGSYNAAATYMPGDAVLWERADGGTGAGYTRIGAGNTTGTPPSDAAKWAIFVETGEPGVGDPGPPGPAATSAYLTNEAVQLPAYANGNVVAYTGATGTFKVFAGSTDISASFALSTVANPQALTIGYAGQTYTVTAGFDPGEDTATVTIRATGSGAYAGVTFDKVFSLSKAKGGYEIVSTLPTTGNFEGRIVFLTTDDKLYRFDGANFTSAVPATDVSGQIIASQIATGAINTAKFAAGIEPVTVVSSVPVTKSTNTIYNTADGESYRWTGTAYTKQIAAGNITGSLSDAQLASISAAKITGALSDAQLASISAAKITGNLTDAQLAGISAAKIIGTLTDAQLVSISAAKVSGTLSDGQLSAISAAKVTGQLVTAQISNGAITGGKLGVGVGSNQLIGAVPGTNPNRFFQLGWNPDNVTLNNAGDGGPVLSPIYGAGFPGAVWTMPDQGTFAVHQNNATPNSATPGVTNALDFYFKYPTGLDGSYSVLYPVEAGKTYEFSLYSGAHRCNVAIFVEWFDENQVSINQTTPFVWNNYEQLGGTILGAYKRLVSRGAAPATARFGRLIVRKTLTLNGQTDSWLMATRAMFAETTTNATEALPYNIPAFGLIHAEVMLANSLNANRIVAGSITSTQIAAGTITAANIAAGTITAGQIAAATITGAKIAGQTITAANLVAGTITANEIAAATITGAKIAAQTITAGNIVAGTITAGQIAASTITGAKIAAGTITAGNLVAGTITANEIAAATITGAKIAAGTITGSNLVAGTITAGEIAAGTITGSRLAAGTITANELAANSVTAGKIAAGAVSADQIVANAIRTQHIAITPSNLVPDPQFRDANLWYQDDESGSGSAVDGVISTTTTGWYRSDDNNPATALRGSSYLNLWAGRPGMNLNARYVLYGRIEMNNCFKPQPGVVYELKANVENYTNQWVVVIVQWVNFANNASVGDMAVFVQPGQTGVFSVQGTPPAGAAYGRVVVHNQGAVSGGAPLTGSLLVTNVVVREAAGATAIIDGSVIANKVAAGAIEADKLAANSVVAGKVAADAITTNNIQAGAITAAKIAVTQLSSISATIGLLRTATSGARLEIENNQIRVYYSNNVLAMRQGVW